MDNWVFAIWLASEIWLAAYTAASACAAWKGRHSKARHDPLSVNLSSLCHTRLVKFCRTVHSYGLVLWEGRLAENCQTTGNGGVVKQDGEAVASTMVDLVILNKTAPNISSPTPH